MPALSGSQVRSRQPRDHMTSSRANRTRRLTHFRQNNAAVTHNKNEVGSPFVIAADWNCSLASFFQIVQQNTKIF